MMTEEQANNFEQRRTTFAVPLAIRVVGGCSWCYQHPAPAAERTGKLKSCWQEGEEEIVTVRREILIQATNNSGCDCIL
jgi:hypothetical protein